MTSQQPFVCRWGILGPGWIASVFAKDLLLDPSTRDVSDVQHIIQAVGTSNSISRAEKFISDVGAPSTTTAYGSYASLVADPNVDVIYIATPHSHHYAQCLLALNAGKNVVCEKPFTVNAAQTEVLIKLAREKNLFLMEAVWTRFFPLSIKVRELITQGRVGDVRRVTADLDLAEKPDTKYADGLHRMVNPDLAGGALLDLGVYPLTWVYQTLYHTLPEAEKAGAEPKVTGAISRFPVTGCDDGNVVIVQFPHAIGVASSGLRVHTDPSGTGRSPAIRIKGSKGEIQVAHPAYCPKQITIIEAGEEGAEAKVEVIDFPIPGGGMFWEADAVARCLRDGEKESKTIPLEESLLLMKAMDAVRYGNGFRYPEGIEKVDL